MAWQGIPVATVGAAYYAPIEGPGISADFLQTILTNTNAVLLSALTLDSLTDSSHDPNRELFGLGLANTAVPFLGSLPVSGVIVRGSTNVMSGANNKSAALMHAIFLGIFVAALASVVARLPMAALAAVLFMTAMRLIEVGEIRRIHLLGSAEERLTLLTAALTVLVDLTVPVPVGLALTLLLVLRRMLKHGTIPVIERNGVQVADPGTQVTFLTSPRIRPQIDEALESDTKRVQALDLSRISALEATGLSIVAEVMDRHPHLDVWVASAERAAALQGTGVPEDRIHIQENGIVHLRDVLRPFGPMIRRN